MRILVTRPEPDAARLGERLKGSGHDPVIEPLMSVGYLEGEIDYAGVQAIAFTSANGVRALVADPENRSLPIFAVGAATAAAAKRAGFKTVHEAGGDVTHLAARIGSMLEPEEGRIIHIAGSVVAGDLQGALASFGFQIDRHVLYETTARNELSQNVIADITSGALDGVMLYSPRTARIFAALVQKTGLTEACAGLSCYCLSDNVANAVADLPFTDCLVAQTPDEDALMALIEDD